MIRLGILGSTRGTNLVPIAEAIHRGELSAIINVVISNKPDAYILERARELAIPACFVDPKDQTREQYDEKVLAVLSEYEIDVIVLIGYMRILSPRFIHQWRNKIINIHPSLLPLHAGKMDLDVHRSVLAANEIETGCTVHYVTEEVDAGPIVWQQRCPVYKDDTPISLKERVQALEGEALVSAIKAVIIRSVVNNAELGSP